MALSNPEKLSSADARKLSGFLRSKKAPSGALSFNQLKGYLFGICTTPALLHPSFWLPEVFGGTVPEFENDADARIPEIVESLYNQTAREVLDGTFKLPSGSSLDSDISSNFQPGSALHEWCAGFTAALEKTIVSWKALSGPEMTGGREQAWARIGFFSDEQTARNGQLAETASDSFDELARKVRLQLPKLMKEYAAACRELYEAELKNGGPAALTTEADAEQAPTETAQPEQKPVSATSDKAAAGRAAQAVNPLLEKARNSKNPAEIIRLCRQIISQQADNTEAWLMLAQWGSNNQKEFIEHLEQAVKAGESELGEAYFTENNGLFWSLPETRPYMRALSSLARAYYLNKRGVEAIALYERCLDLSPVDEQGIRHSLVNLYLELGQPGQAAELLSRFKEDNSAFFQYSRALLSYMQEGDSGAARSLKKEARTGNKHVPKLLSGRSKMPKQLPSRYSVGDKDEAILYTSESRNAWRTVMGSVSWLLK